MCRNFAKDRIGHSSNKLSLTVHVVPNVPDKKVFDLLATIRKLLSERFGVSHTTAQIERTPCEHADGAHTFAVGTDHRR